MMIDMIDQRMEWGAIFSDKLRKNSAPGCGCLLLKRFHGKRILDTKSEAIQTETSGPASEKVCNCCSHGQKQDETGAFPQINVRDKKQLAWNGF